MSESKQRGRPTKFDASVAANIVRALSSGAWKKTAAAWAGIDYTTLKRWLRKGRALRRTEPEHELAVFARKVLEAENGCEIRAGQVAYKAAMEDPDIALRWLAVRHRKRWHPKASVEISGNPKKPVHHAHSQMLAKLSDADLDTIEEIATRAAAAAAAAVGDPGGEG